MTNPTWDSFSQVPEAGYVFPTHTFGSQLGDEFSAPQVPELVLSTHRLTTAGVVVAGGQGILPVGTVMGQTTSDGKYRVYNSSNSDGTQTPVGILRKEYNTSNGPGGTAQDLMGVLVTGGVLRNSLVSGASSGYVTALNARVDTVSPVARFIF